MSTNFTPTSRYYGIETAETTAPDGRKLLVIALEYGGPGREEAPASASGS